MRNVNLFQVKKALRGHGSVRIGQRHMNLISKTRVS